MPALFIRGRSPNTFVRLGWNSEFKSYFAEIWNADLGAPTFWLGDGEAELPTVERLALALVPYADVPPEVKGRLRAAKGDHSPDEG